MDPYTQGNFSKMKFLVLVSMCGLMVKRILVNGLKIKCMAMVNLNGRTESNILVSLKTINAKAKEPLLGAMAVFTRVTGVMASNMVRVCLLNQMVRKELVYGRMAETLNG